MTWLAAWMLLLIFPGRQIEVEVDRIELNHLYSANWSTDEFGRSVCRINPVASYWLFWSRYEEGFHIRDWVRATSSDPDVINNRMSLKTYSGFSS